ncbi:tetratricopeptide repeat protein [Celerinatantimonas yamalensis]|uniref:Tetratricopeptide repeat protein n=1 Tax=Celerinatantimonas yamalensis TaxID=559956 RepID=A0ABW9G4C0_9GAMM
MDSVIKQAIDLRQAGLFEQSRTLLTSLLNDESYRAIAHLHIAWSHDNEGSEQQAIVHYLEALQGTLTIDQRFDALFGLASTYRSLGCYTEALAYFEYTLSEYPDALEVQPFYAMCLYNVGRHKQATALLLELLVASSDCKAIKRYQRAILLYAQDLDKIW